MRALALAALLALAPAAAAQDVAPVASDVSRARRVAGVMGSELQVELLGPDPAHLERVLDLVVAEFRRVEDLCTDWRDSPLERVNQAAGRGPQAVPPELARLVARALEWGRRTGGAFDITFAAVGKLWDFKRRPPVVPDAAAITSALAFVGWHKVKVDLEASTIDLPAGMRLGLGGIGQGYAVDTSMDIVLAEGVRHALINHSGDIKALGRGKDGKPWPIAVRHPREEGRALAVLPISNACLTTAGDYEKCFVLDGVRYHHIIDCRTGWPAKGAMSATVVAPSCADADVLDTALIVLGPEAGLELIRSLPRTEAIIVGMDGQVHVTPGLQARR